jgi:predicted PurR-regulated permease PerM
MLGNSDRPRIRRRSRGERRVTYGLKVLALVALAALMLSAVLHFIGRIGSVAVILIGAIFFTYAVYPLVRRLNARVPLVGAIALVYLGIAAIAGFGVAVVLPALYDDVQSLAHAMPAFVQSAQHALSDPRNPVIRRLPEPARDYLAKVPAQVAALAERYGADAASRVVTFVLSIVSLVATVVVIPVMSIYLMIEAPSLLAAVIRIVPPKWRPEAESVLHDLDAVFGGFIRGQILVGAVIGTCITIALLVLHVKYALLIGVLAGIFDVIPYVGALVGFVPSVLLALFNDGWPHALVVAAVFVAIFQLEGHFIAPRIVSDSVGLSPLMVIVAILIGGELLGIPGMFVAVPVAGALRVILLHAVPRARAPLPSAVPSAADTAPAVATATVAAASPIAPPIASKKAQGVRP